MEVNCVWKAEKEAVPKTAVTGSERKWLFRAKASRWMCQMLGVACKATQRPRSRMSRVTTPTEAQYEQKQTLHQEWEGWHSLWGWAGASELEKLMMLCGGGVMHDAIGACIQAIEGVLVARAGLDPLRLYVLNCVANLNTPRSRSRCLLQSLPFSFS
eukprot:3250920-Pleurochrysis_carterae.AAC.2